MAEPAGAAPDASSHTLRRVGRVLGVLIVVGAVALSVVVWRLSNVHPRTDDAAVRANVVGIAPHVSGAIVELQVVDNQRVKAGDLLFLVDPRPYEARRAGPDQERGRGAGARRRFLGRRGRAPPGRARGGGCRTDAPGNGARLGGCGDRAPPGRAGGGGGFGGAARGRAGLCRWFPPSRRAPPRASLRHRPPGDPRP